LAYFQIVLGALVRHFPTDGRPSVFQGVVMFHIAVGAALAFYIFATTVGFARQAWRVKACLVPALLLSVLVMVQLALGAATWVYKYNYPAFMGNSQAASEFTVQAMDWRQAQITTAHVATGSLILALSAVLAVNSARLLKIEKIGNRIAAGANVAVQPRRAATSAMLEVVA
jgi:cytochrome c oxidase assembly protein subunit 15